jgi:hypothetical protein
MQSNLQQLAFLQNKIEQLQNAEFHNLSDSASRLPSSVVTTLTTDDSGYVWFLVKKPPFPVSEIESEFPVRLNYFKKGINYFLQIRGKGFSVTNAGELSSFINSSSGLDFNLFNDNLLVKVKMLNADYFETPTSEKTNWWQNAISSIGNWFGTSDPWVPKHYIQS